MNKFRWDEFISTLQTVITPLMAQFDNPRSGIVRNTLLLTSEMFMGRRDGGEALLETFIPALMIKSINEKAFIKI